MCAATSSDNRRRERVKLFVNFLKVVKFSDLVRAG